MNETFSTIVAIFGLPYVIQLFDGPFQPVTITVARYLFMYGFIVMITYMYNLARAIRTNKKCKDNVGLKKGLKLGVFCIIFMYFININKYARVPFTIFGPSYADSLILLTIYWLGYGIVSLQHGTC